jgi:hypothetical protein
LPDATRSRASGSSNKRVAPGSFGQLLRDGFEQLSNFLVRGLGEIAVPVMTHLMKAKVWIVLALGGN